MAVARFFRKSAEDGLNLRVGSISPPAKDELDSSENRDIEGQLDKRPKASSESRFRTRRRCLCCSRCFRRLRFRKAQLRHRVHYFIYFILFTTIAVLLCYMAFFTPVSPKLEVIKSRLRNTEQAMAIKNHMLEEQLHGMAEQLQNASSVSLSRKKTIESLQNQLMVHGAENLYRFTPPDFSATIGYTVLCLVAVAMFVFYRIYKTMMINYDPHTNSRPTRNSISNVRRENSAHSVEIGDENATSSEVAVGPRNGVETTMDDRRLQPESNGISIAGQQDDTTGLLDRPDVETVELLAGYNRPERV